jgi:hypothetical protein
MLPMAVFIECERFYTFRAYSVTADTIGVRVKINYLLVPTLVLCNVSVYT